MCKGNSNDSTQILHPLQPLSVSEMEQAVKVVRMKYEKTWGIDAVRFEFIGLDEPDDKSIVRQFQKGGDAVIVTTRVARVHVFSATTGELHTVWVDLMKESNSILNTQIQPSSAKPMIQLEEFMQIEECVKAHPEFIAGCQKRGILNMEFVCIDPWSSGGGDFGHDDDDEVNKHLSHVFGWIKSSANDNLYAHPLEGLHAVVDIRTMQVVRVDDYGVTAIPTQDVNYDREFLTDIRSDLKPLDIVQPEGVSFTLEGNLLKWHNWSLVVGFNAREALTLHDLQYAGRPVVYRASLAEMVVPYGSPKAPHFRKNVFDIGEYGIGKLANSLTLGCDCLGTIQYLDGILNDMQGNVVVLPNAVCIHEEDAGIAWKHWDFRTERTEVRRGRRLVVSSVSTVGNYEYGSYWYLYFDGRIEFEMKATGIINTVACVPGTPQKYGTEVSPGVVGHIHQHLFCARLDMAVDGDDNTVYACDTKSEPLGPDNPHGNAFFVESTKLEQAGGWCRNPDTERYWKFCSSSKTNHVGQPTAYKLEPVHAVKSFNHPEGTTSKRMQFIRNHLWVTPYNKEERFPAGEFVNGSDGSDGVHKYAATGKNIADTDVVAWHVFGLHHLPRTEDFPVQPVVTTGFSLHPVGFFDTNPMLDLPYDANVASKHACCRRE